ncbi:MAG: hypothetical protein WD055_01390 [Candidatus Dependentiae bacterium]
MKIMYRYFLFVLMVLSIQAKLSPPPKGLQTFHEIAVQYKSGIDEIFNTLHPEERIFLYYLYRASLPGHYLCSHQIHRHAVEIMDLFESILEQREQLKKMECQLDFSVEDFTNEVITYLVYLWTNHGQYFLHDEYEQKRTPLDLKCQLITPENLQKVISVIGSNKSINHLLSSIFDNEVEKTLCVDGDIAESAINIYHPDFTEQDFVSLPEDKRSQINAYFDVAYVDDERCPHVNVYKVGGRCSQELEVAVHWLQKAYEHVRHYPQLFDIHTERSLDYLIQFLKTGDEELFKQHSVEWIKTHNKLDYNFGWIEVYLDPKQYRGGFQAEVTAKTIDMKMLNALLPSLEGKLPFPDEYKRKSLDDLSAIPNASINIALFATGELGPLEILAAYCLPNYDELRTQHGSKQIIYHSEKGLKQLTNPALARALFSLPKQVEWLKEHDPEGKLGDDIWNLGCILHETLGHGSGRLHKHTFRDGDKLVIGNKAYNIGDTIDVTSINNNELLGKYGQSLEELRAEIISLYTSVFNFDELAQAGLYKDWPEKIGKERLIKELIKGMVWTGLSRLLSQSKKSNEIRGAHAQANTTILNFLLDGGGLQLLKENVEVEGETYQVLGFEIDDVEQVKKNIVALAQEVQRIKSTGDGQALTVMMKKYGITMRNPEHRDILQRNDKAVAGDLVVIASLYPHYYPVKSNDKVVDVDAVWPKDVVEHFMRQKKYAYSKE